MKYQNMQSKSDELREAYFCNVYHIYYIQYPILRLKLQLYFFTILRNVTFKHVAKNVDIILVVGTLLRKHATITIIHHPES